MSEPPPQKMLIGGVNMTSLLEMRMGGAGLEIGVQQLYELTNSLLDIKGPLKKKLTSSTIREANEAIRSVSTKQSAKREIRSYAEFTPEEQAEVAKYASIYAWHYCCTLLFF